MPTKNYSELVNEFFDEFEKTLAPRKKGRVVSVIVNIISVTLFIILGALNFEIAIIPFMILMPVSLIYAVVNEKKIEKEVEKQECYFFDEVYMQILAGELDAEIVSEVERDGKIKPGKPLLNIGLHQTIAVDIAGSYNNKPYRLSQFQAVYMQPDEIGCHPVTVGDDMSCERRLKHPVDSQITISSPLSCFDSNLGKPVRMDNKSFKFNVNCDDPVVAYKFLTPGVMEEITRLNEAEKLKKIVIDSGKMEIYPENSIIDLNFLLSYSMTFSKNMERNRRNYSAESIVKDLSPAVDRTKNFLSKSDMTSIV